MKFNKTILAAALLSVVAVGCASNDHKEEAPAPTVTSDTTTEGLDETGSVSDSDVMTDDSVTSGATTDDAREEGEEILDDEAKKRQIEETTPPDSGSTTEPMDESWDSGSSSGVDPETGTTTTDGM